MQGYQSFSDELGDPDFVPIAVLIQNLDGDPPGLGDAAYFRTELELNLSVAVDADGSWAADWNPTGVFPEGTVVGRDGIVTWSEVGGSAKTEERARDAVIAALAAK